MCRSKQECDRGLLLGRCQERRLRSSVVEVRWGLAVAGSRSRLGAAVRACTQPECRTLELAAARSAALVARVGLLEHMATLFVLEQGNWLGRKVKLFVALGLVAVLEEPVRNSAPRVCCAE